MQIHRSSFKYVIRAMSSLKSEQKTKNDLNFLLLKLLVWFDDLPNVNSKN